MRTLTAAQTQVLKLPTYQACIRVLVDRGDGTMVDLTNFLGENWVKTVKWSENIDDVAATFTVTLWREKYFNSLAPSVAASQANNQTGSYVPLLFVGRKIEIDTAVLPYDVQPISGDWIVSFQGYIDQVDPSKVDFEIELDGRDLSAKVADRWAESSIVASPLGVALETSMQNDVLTGIFAAGGGGAPTLFTPSSPGWILSSPYVMQPGQGCLDQLSQMAAQIGWDVRYYWDNGTSAFRLTLQQPLRSSPTSLQTFQVYQLTGAEQDETDISWVRNVVTVGYSNASPPAGTLPGGAYLSPFSPITVTSAASISKYGRRFCAIGLGATSNILDSTHASALANAVLADLQDPMMTLQVDLQFRPEVQLMDYYTFAAPTPWWDSAQSLAVQAISHEFDLPGDDGQNARAFTTLTCWGSPSTSPRNWHESMTGNGTAPPVKNNAPATPTITAQSDIRGVTAFISVPNLNQTDWFDNQLHASTTNGFTPSVATLIERAKRSTIKGS